MLLQVTWAADISGNPIGCQSSRASFQRVLMTGKVLLNEAFLPKNEEAQKKLIEEAIELQSKHLMGFLKNNREGVINSALSAFRGRARVLSTLPVKYENALQIKNFLPVVRGESKSPYVKSALTRGFSGQEDAAILVNYEVELMVGDCTPKGFVSSSEIVLPLDPFLSLWVARALEVSQRDLKSDCLSNEIDHFGNADTSWFFWNPQRSRPRPCRMKPSSVFRPDFKILEEIKALESPSEGPHQENKKLSITAIFGMLDQGQTLGASDISNLKEMTDRGLKHCQMAKLIPECLSEWKNLLGPSASREALEPGLQHYFVFLKYLSTLVRIQKFRLKDTEKNEILVEVEGHFIDSNEPVAISIYYGRTTLDYGPRASSAYLQLMYRALGHSDAISYVGHAGLGENLKMSTLQKLWDEERLRPFLRTSPLLLGIYSCEAFSYFGFDIEKLFKPDFLDVVLIESSGADVGAKFPLAQLFYLKNRYSPRPLSLQSVMGRYVESRQFLMSLRLH